MSGQGTTTTQPSTPGAASATHGSAQPRHSGAGTGQPPAAKRTLVQSVPVKPAPAPHTSFVQEIQNFAYNWSPVVMIVFFTALIFLMWRTLKVMPRVKPQRIRPSSNQA